MGKQVLVQADGQKFFVEVADGGGPQTVSADQVLSFDGVRATIEALAGQLSAAWDRVKPSEATVAFGLSFSAKTGMLTALIVDGATESSLTITLTWKNDSGSA
ncbi:CU044_2847 family protein [Streptomyces sp. NPDC002209]|uniref:CU044_2847 family protein n=1 Tax=Streptomyces sp. NPDC002209 TaxID=3364638 RepID=UPI00368321EC